MEQLTEDQISELAAIDTPTISNAVEGFELRSPVEGFMGPEIRCLFPELGPMVAYAVTATADTTTPGRVKEIRIPELLQAIQESPKPVVLIIKSEGAQPIRTCTIGELISSAMQQLGAVGVVTDGCIRDLQPIRKAGFHAFAVGSVVSHGSPSIGKINVPVEVSGVRVEPGDLIHADENGVLKIPSGCVCSLADEARKILDQERTIIESLQTQGLTGEVMQFFGADQTERNHRVSLKVGASKTPRRELSIPPDSARSRFHRVMKFQSVDRVTNCEFGPWPQTLERWYGEGLGIRLPTGSCWSGQSFFGLDPLFTWTTAVDTGPIPRFEEQVLEETDRHIVARNDKGIVTRALKTGYLDNQRLCMDQYLDFPVKNRADFEALKERHDPDSPDRYPDCLTDFKTRTAPLVCPGSVGLYMKLREWMGTENLSVAFHEQPDLIHDMLDFITDFHLRIADRVSGSLDADLYSFAEDIAYKNGPLVSPRMFGEFFAPRYKRITSHLRKKGIDIFMLESDGNLELLFPQFIECGITANIPVEVAADMDLVKLRKEYGKDMAWIGGIDKRRIAAGKEEIKKELEAKLPFLVESGGCIPMIDGDLAPDISLENFCYYLELKSRYLSRG